MINKFYACPSQYYYRYILRIPEEPSIHIYKGRVVHDIVEKLSLLSWHDIKNNCKTETELHKFMAHIGSNICITEIERGGIKKYCVENKIDWLETLTDITKIVDRYILWYVMQFFVYVDAGKPAFLAFKNMHPKATEIDVRISSDMCVITTEGEKLPVILRGKIDAVLPMGDSAGVAIVDYKTSKPYKMPMREEYIRQLEFYSYIYAEKYGQIPELMAGHYLRTCEWVAIIPPDDLAQKVLRRVRFFIDCVNRNIYQSNPTYKFCNKKWCPYWRQCHKEGRYNG